MEIHKEEIECPECGKRQQATVLHNRCKIYRSLTTCASRPNGGRRAYQQVQNCVRLTLKAAQIREIGFTEAVISARELTIRRAGIDDRRPQKLRSDMHLATDDESICGEYLLEKENEDLWRLVKAE